MTCGAGTAVSAERLLVEEVSTDRGLCGCGHGERGAQMILRGCRPQREIRVRFRASGEIETGRARDRKRRRRGSRDRGSETVCAIGLGKSGEASVRDAEVSVEGE